MMSNEQGLNLPNDEYMRKPEAVKRTTLSDSTLRRMEAKGRFPKRRHISAGLVGWYRSQVLHWLATGEVVDM